jgi:uncharacterized RDD family membrane protein YckC
MEMEEQRGRIEAEYAGFWIRLLACLIDCLVICVVSAILSGVFWMFTFPFWGWHWGNGWDKAPFEVWRMIFAWFVAAAYFTVFWALRSETLGMMLLRLRIVHADGTRLKGDWEAALLRFLGYFLCWATAGLLFLWVAFDERKQGFQDKIANTFVVRLPPKL